ncbi:hypothetical protein [Spiroplasma endosymbiont of Nebria brevicollis]|uniref:hypothetical protein n=1 Tax=Spiroplasma endosymbiont of Nebria brevicollis TaxID=3066284 RepID=UPI00313BC451
MNNYLLSIDPSIKNTGFTLWENKKPVWINSYSFKKYTEKYIEIKFNAFIIDEINSYDECINKNNLYLVIERGIFNPKFGKGKETLDHLRGFITGQFNKLLTKDMLISPKQWQNWYLKEWSVANFKKINKWDKYLSLELANELIEQYYWNITISNHDEADSLLIGWYYLDKEVK